MCRFHCNSTNGANLHQYQTATSPLHSNSLPHPVFITDSVRAFKQRMKLGRFADKDPVAEAEAAAKEQQEKEETEAILIGARCEVTLAGSSMAKRGTVMFAGRLGHITH